VNRQGLPETTETSRLINKETPPPIFWTDGGEAEISLKLRRAKPPKQHVDRLLITGGTVSEQVKGSGLMSASANTQRPVAPRPIDPRTIPALAKLIPFNRWCLWRYVPGTKPGKWTKPPYQITGVLAESDNPATWNDFLTVWQAVQDPKFDGIGFMLKDLPRLAVLDLDDVRDPQTGALVPWAKQTVRDANSYTEITPSYCGLRVIGLVSDSSLSIHKGNTKHPSGEGAYEVYVNTVRYITVTGQQLRLPEVPR
jgi:hypothetical protein